MESKQHPSLLDEQRVTRTLVDLTLENLSSLQPLERSVFELHKCDILQWLQELLRLDKAITESSSQLEVRERLKDSFLYRTNINKALSELDASLPCLDVITPVMTSTPSDVVPPAGIELARPKITCPTFNGLDKANKFALRDFLTRFEFCTAGLTTDKERLICLKAYVVGRPFHLIHHLSESDRNYHVAVNILKGEYWDKEAIREEIFKRILNFTPKVDESYQQIKEYLAQVHYELGELDNDYGYDFLFEGSGSGALVAHILFEGIPGEIRAELVRVSNSPYPSLGCILQGSKDVIKALLRVRPALKPRMNSSVRIKGRVPNWTKDVTKGSGLETFHADLDVADIQYCNFCARNGHNSLNCGIYPSYDERLMRCGQLGICEFCTVTGHDGESCPGVKGFRYPCEVCRSRRHHSSMCPRVKPEKTQTSTSVSTGMGDAQNILPMVKITIKRGKYSVSFNCLVDSGSQRSYFSREVLDHLKCDPKSTEEVAMEVVTFVGRRRRKFKQVTAIVELFPGISPQLPILIDEKLNLSHKVSDLALVWQNLKERYELAAETGGGCVQLWGLMGVDLIQYMHPVRVVRCMNGIAWQTPAGIIPIGNTNHFLYDEQISPINTIVHVRDYDRTIRGHSCPNSLVHSIMNPAPSYLDPFADVFEESSVDRGLEWMFSLESLGLPDTETISDYDHQKVEEFMRNIVFQDGHYLVKLPWHEDKIRRVQSNHHVALKVLDKDGVIRSGGRIGKVSVYEYEVINPILIAKDHPLTSLIILDCHKHCKHLGVSTTLNKVRMCGYWIPQGRQAVKRVLSGCALCQKFNTVPFTYPRMTDLPKHRVNMVKPFLHTGMDFTGHLWVLSGGERTKMYILVFTCLEVRAVHLELVEDMTAHSFLMAFIRFTNTYGIPSHVYSDNAKSFVAGCNIIHDAFSSSEFKESLGNCVIQHIKIPLHSPWCGGVWERLIKNIKSCLYKLIGRASYTYFNLLTILSDVQNAINDRPLTYRGSADPGLEIITPNHFLHPTVNPRIILRLNNWSIYQVEPPSRRQLLDSLTARDETLERFRRIWYQDYLLSLREHAQKQPSKAASGVSVGEIVIVKVPNKSRPFWVLGRVTCLYPGDDGLIRSAQIKRGDGSLQTHSLKHLHPLELSIEEHVNCPASLPRNQDGSVEPDDHPSTHLGDDFPADDSCRIWICPGCNQPDDGSAMVCCDQCDYWYHFHCVDMCQPPPVEEGWYCPNCLDQRDD